jgi:PKD repeat protein
MTKASILHTFRLFPFYCFAILLPTFTNAQFNPYQDSLALVSLYNATGGNGWKTKANWKTVGRPISTWHGVVVNDQGCVEGLHLPNNQLSGNLPNLNLPCLKELDLSGNWLTGNIPSFETYPLINKISLAGNRLSGRIHHFNLPYLQELSLARNFLTDTIPNFYLPNLLHLSLDSNLLTGKIPNFYLPNLKTLSLHHNRLTGEIANFNLPRLEHLMLNDNQLTGFIPNFNLPNLKNLFLQHNLLRGCIPANLKGYCQAGFVGNIANNPNLVNQNWTSFCGANEGVGPHVALTTTDSTVFCYGRTITLTANTSGASSYTYKWYRNNVLIPEATDSTLRVSNSGGYNVEVQTAACENRVLNPTPLTIAVYPGAPQVGDTVYCQNQTAAQLTATGVGQLLWYTTATGGTGSPIAPTPSTLVAGFQTYYVSRIAQGCEGPRAAATILVKPMPVAPTTSNITYCQNAASLPLNATGSELTWYTSSTGGTGSSTAPTPSTSSLGTTTYYVSQKSNGCESPRAAISVLVSTYHSAPTVSPIFACQNATLTPLSATGVGQILWYYSPTGGTGSTVAPIPSTTNVGTTNFYVSQSVGGCESPRAVLAVTVSPQTAAPTANAINYCQNAISTPLSISGSNLRWYSAATGGTGNATAPTPSTVAPGTTHYFVSQTIGGCESPRAQVSVTVNAIPAPPSTTNVTYCQNAQAVPLTATGANLMWFNQPIGGAGNRLSSTPTTDNVGVTVYYVSQTVNNCESPRASLVVVVNPLPFAPQTTPVQYCQNASAIPLSTNGTNLLWYTQATGGTGNPTAPTPATTTVGTTNYYVSQSALSCESPRASLPVLINPKPIADFITTIQGGVVNFTNTSIEGANYRWTFYYGTELVSTVQNPSFTYLSNGNYQVKLVTTSAAGCVDSTTKTVNISRVATTELGDKLSVEVFPNPVQAVLYLKINDLSQTIKPTDRLFITNAIGQVVENLPMNQASLEINTSQWARGIYFLTAQLNGRWVRIESVIKE